MTTKAQVESAAVALRDRLFQKSQDGRFSPSARARLANLHSGVSNALQQFSASPGDPSMFGAAKQACDTASARAQTLPPGNEAQLQQLEGSANDAIDALVAATAA